MKNMINWAVAALLLASAQQLFGQTLLVDRGLPTSNLNNAAGNNRSNVSWGEPNLSYFDGDTFTVSSAGTTRVDTIRLWFMGYGANNNANLTDDTFLGNASFGNLSLYVGAVGNPLDRVSVASFVAGSDATSNPNVVATRVQYNGGLGTELDYENSDSSPPYLTIVQLDFNNLNLDFAPGTIVQFGMGTDRDYTLSSASNAALSGSPQDQADGLYRQFLVDANPSTATFVSILDSNGNGWDKSSDVNVQVFGTVPEGGSTLILMGFALAGLGALRRRIRKN